MIDCRICGGLLESFIDFGSMPLANAFTLPDDPRPPYRFRLAAGRCAGCGMVQLIDQPPPELMFTNDYPFFTGSSKRMSEHFSRFAADAEELLAGRSDPLVVEVGCNDGTFLRHFAERRIRHLGIDPASNAIARAGERGVSARACFFTEEIARETARDLGAADLLVAANVVCHVPELNGFLSAASALLAKDGLLVFEEPYLGDILRLTAYDQFYDEHVYYFSAASLVRAASRHGWDLVDATRQKTHGGSMRYLFARTGRRNATPNASALLRAEEETSLGSRESLESFALACARSRDALNTLLDRLAREGRRVAGYGATSKSTTVINYCGITTREIAFITDTTPEKQGRLSPGARIPIRSHEHFAANHPDYAVLFAWNHKEEIEEKEREFLGGGGRWIVYVPSVGIEAGAKP